MHRKSLRKTKKAFALHRWFFPLAVLGGGLLVLLPMLLSADDVTVLSAVTVTEEGFSAVAPVEPLPLTGLAARFAACADRLLIAAVNLLLYAIAGTLAVRTAPVGKKLLFVWGLSPFLLQSAAALAPEGWLPGLFLLYFAQVLALAFVPVRAGGRRWVCFALTGGALLWACLQYKAMLLPALLCAGLIPLRRFLPLGLLAPTPIPDADGLRKAKLRRFWLQTLQAVLYTGFFAGLCAVFAAVLPAPRVVHNLLQHRTEFLLDMTADKGLKLLRLLLGGSFAGSDGAVLLHVGVVPLVWGLLGISTVFGTAEAFRPSRRQRVLALTVCAVGAAGSFAAYLSWAELFSTALGLCWLPPVLLWALTPNALVLRRERPARLVPVTALALVLSALPGLTPWL